MSWYRSALRHSYLDCTLRAESRSGDIYVIASLGDLNAFRTTKDSELNVSPYLQPTNTGGLIWDPNGGQPSGQWINPRISPEGSRKQGERRLGVMRPKKDEKNQTEPESGSEEMRFAEIDKYLDIIEEYDNRSRQFTLRLTVKRPTSKRSIVLCFDGTSNYFSNQNTNVVKLVELLKKNDPSEQMTGVGTYSPFGTNSRPGFFTGMVLSLLARWDEATAWFLYQHVIDGYKFLMETYQGPSPIDAAYTALTLVKLSW
ncbi:hypothetical protein RhiTH_010769 [Rhizoctonia solani]